MRWNVLKEDRRYMVRCTEYDTDVYYYKLLVALLPEGTSWHVAWADKIEEAQKLTLSQALEIKNYYTMVMAQKYSLHIFNN